MGSPGEGSFGRNEAAEQGQFQVSKSDTTGLEVIVRNVGNNCIIVEAHLNVQVGIPDLHKVTRFSVSR